MDEDEEGSEEEDSDEDFFTGESDAGAGTASDYVAPAPQPSASAASKSKGSSSTPRKAWMCEHCTFVNNAGTGVCTVCCRTSTHSRSGVGHVQSHSINSNDTANQSQGNTSSKTKSKKASRSASTNRRPRYNYSDDEDLEEDLSDFERQRSLKAGRLMGLQQQQHRGRFQKLGRGRTGMAKSMTDLDSLGPRSGGVGGGGLDDEFDLEQDATNAYYAVRMGERRRSTAVMRREDEEGELRATLHCRTILLVGQGCNMLCSLGRVNTEQP